VSIVTPTLNRGELLADAIESVEYEDAGNLEHIIVDGGTDELTLEIVSAHRHLRHIREPDRGVYDAFNKGLKAARGEVIGFLNSDDRYEHGALQAVTRIFAEREDVDIVSGGAVVERLGSGQDDCSLYNAAANKMITIESATFGIPVFNAHFFRKSVFTRLGCFDLDYPLLSDREFLIRVKLAGLTNKAIRDILYRYRAHADSLTLGGRMNVIERIGRERMLISEKYLDSGLLDAREQRLMRAWHTDGAVVEAASHIKGLKWSALPGIVGRAGRYNRAWRRDMAKSLSRKLAPAFIRRRSQEARNQA
jgi:glycosyltransferase involved in cell wall biosynthesis